MFTDIHRNPWGSMRIYEDPWGSMRIYEDPWGSTGIHEDPPGSMRIHQDPWGSTRIHEDPPGSMRIHQDPRGSTRIQQDPPESTRSYQDPLGSGDPGSAFSPLTYTEQLWSPTANILTTPASLRASVSFALTSIKYYSMCQHLKNLKRILIYKRSRS
jgi:hypothetical protein